MLFNDLKLSEKGCVVIKNADVEMSLGEKCSEKVKSNSYDFSSEMKDIEERVRLKHTFGLAHKLHYFLQAAEMVSKLHRLCISACHAFYNVAVSLAILVFGVWKSHRPSLLFGLANPALKIAAFAIEEIEIDHEHFSSGINLIMMYPIVDGAVVSGDVVAAARDGSVGSYLQYIFGCFYLILLRRRLENLKSLQQANQTKQLEEAPTFTAAVKAKVVYPEWYLHSCLYGHKGRLKCILLTCVDLDINQVGYVFVL